MKYGNKKTNVDGIVFGSQREAKRYLDLTLLVRSGHISNLKTQVRFELAPSVMLGGRKKPALRYVADFVYSNNAKETIVEDVKGVVTPLFRVKQHLMKSVHNIEVIIV